MVEWYGKQKRGEDGILVHYYDLFEALSDCGSLPEKRKEGLYGCWESFLINVLCQEKHLLNRLANSKQNRLSDECFSLAERYLKLMQVIREAAPRQLCFSFFTLLSPFTRESVYLPYFSSNVFTDSLPEKEIGEFAELLITSKEWGTKAEEYLKLLKSLNSDNEI